MGALYGRLFAFSHAESAMQAYQMVWKKCIEKSYVFPQKIITSAINPPVSSPIPRLNPKCHLRAKLSREHEIDFYRYL